MLDDTALTHDEFERIKTMIDDAQKTVLGKGVMVLGPQFEIRMLAG